MNTTAPLLGEPIAVELMNTIWADRDGVHDALASAEQAQAWLHAIAPRVQAIALDAQPTPAALPAEVVASRLRSLRDALRRLAAEATGDPRATARSTTADVQTAVAELNGAAAGAPRWSSLQWSDHELASPVRIAHATAGPDAAFISEIAEQGIDLLAGAGSEQLRACLAPGCVLYFVKNHPRREWCSASCGNRARVARHYRRHHGDPAPS